LSQYCNQGSECLTGHYAGDILLAVRNGISVSSIPFEQRYLPPAPRRRRAEKLTATDRLVCAICGAFLGFVLWVGGYLILVSAALKGAARHGVPDQMTADPFGFLPPFWWGVFVALAFALFGAIVGAERMMDGFGNAVQAEGKVAEALNRS
jgi:hypothetical protein